MSTNDGDRMPFTATEGPCPSCGSQAMFVRTVALGCRWCDCCNTRWNPGDFEPIVRLDA